MATIRLKLEIDVNAPKADTAVYIAREIAKDHHFEKFYRESAEVVVKKAELRIPQHTETLIGGGDG